MKMQSTDVKTVTCAGEFILYRGLRTKKMSCQFLYLSNIEAKMAPLLAFARKFIFLK